MHDSTLTREFLQTNGLSEDTRLYREAIFSALQPSATPGVFRLSANAAPGDSVIDVYGAGHLVQAESVGAGLSFAESSNPNWQETMELRVLRAGNAGELADPVIEVEVRLGDLLRQGSRIYPVESVTVERAWYCTMPEGAVDVRLVDGPSN